MFNSVALDVVIGLVFIYLLYSLLVTIIQEIIATNLGFRAKVLEKSIVRMLEDDVLADPNGFNMPRFLVGARERVRGYLNMIFKRNVLRKNEMAAAFYEHPLIKYMAEDKFHSKPSYISAENFSKVMIDLLHGVSQNGEPMDMSRIRESVNAGKLIHHNMLTQESQTNTTGLTEINEDTRLLLISLLQSSGGRIDAFQASLEQWFLDTQARASGWYKKYTQVILFTIGFAIAMAFNVDTLLIVKKLSKDPKLREQVVQSAVAFSEKNHDLGKNLENIRQMVPDTTQEYKDYKAMVKDLYEKNLRLANQADSIMRSDIQASNQLLGLGWDPKRDDFNSGSLIGWLLTAVALSLGAPFWFDMLNKLIKIRGAKKTENETVVTTTGSTAGSTVVQPVVVNAQTDEEAVG